MFDSKINKQIIMGNFPNEFLEPTDKSVIGLINIEELAKEGIDVFKSNPGLMNVFLKIAQNRVDIYDDSLIDFNPINAIINSDCLQEYFYQEPDLLNEIVSVSPFVTKTDKLFWYEAAEWFGVKTCLPSTIKVDFTYTWIYLLRIMQEKEARYGVRFNTKLIDSDDRLIDLVLADWKGMSKKLFIDLTDSEKKQLKQLIQFRQAIIKKINEIEISGENIAIDTNNAWSTFIELANDLSSTEKEVICKINNETFSAKDKTTTINKYLGKRKDIEYGHYELNGQNVELIPIFDAVMERYKGASTRCCVLENGKPIMVFPSLPYLVMNPDTYNAVFIKYHFFRLNPNKESAKHFFESANIAIHKNLGLEDDTTYKNIEDIIQSVFEIINNFVNENAKALDTLEFTEILDDAVSIPGISVSLKEGDFLNKEIMDWFNGLNLDYDKELDKSISSKVSVDELNSILSFMQEMDNKSENKALASQIVRSLNIIYIMCDAIRIALNNKHANIKFRDKDAINKIRRSLLKIDARLVQKIYSDVDVLEYREKNAIDISILSEYEVEEEKYRNSLFAEAFKDIIFELVHDIESQNIDQLFETKKKIKEQIHYLPACDEKEQYADWLDGVSERLCNALISQCKEYDENSFDSVKELLKTDIGSCYSILPTATMDSLTTAEILYKQYANEEYEKKGFDFSSISALYYQAFENAYNQLIWIGYANKLNSLDINGVPFIDTIKAAKIFNNNSNSVSQFLGSQYDTVKLYIEFGSKKKGTVNKITEHCMFKAFATLVKKIKDNEADELSQYFAQLVGFKDSHEMFNDSNYCGMLSDFYDSINKAVPNRNNASHGGTIINMEQCSADKETVLSQLDVIRNNNLGLIHQLLTLLTYKK